MSERYQYRLRPHSGIIHSDASQQADEALGIWDTERKCFVRRSESGSWEPEQ